MKKIRVLLVDDHHLFREGLARILENQSDFEVVGEAVNGQEGIEKARQLKPDLILMDVVMPVCDGLQATQQIKGEQPQVTIVMLTISDEDDKLFEAIRSGAQGYLLKSIRREEMLTMLRGAMQGEAAITPALGGRMLSEFRRLGQRPPAETGETSAALSAREQEILILAASGDSNKEISEKLCISIHTVKSHMRKLLAKLQLANRREAAAYARRAGLVPSSKKAS
jgi:DNA-binding NarL/FixJ family response regulator